MARNNRKGKYRAESKRRIGWIWIPIVFVLILLSVLFVLRNNRNGQENFAPSSEIPETTVESLQNDSSMPAVYQMVLLKYRTAMAEKWDYGQCMEAEISPLISEYADAPDNFGYALIDLDEDGIDELIITDGNVLLDVYIRFGEETQNIITGWERNVYYLCEDNLIFNRGSNGAASTVYNFYRISPDGLNQTGSVVFDAMVNPDNPWSYQERETDTFVTISEEEANMIIASFVPVKIEFTSIMSE